MNALGEKLQKEIIRTEEDKRNLVENSPYRAAFHLMPPVGWLNDPNGLCQFNGVYHLFFQYSPFHVDGGLKAWGHYTSSNLVSFEYKGTPILPDESFDRDGVYSGSAWVEHGRMHLFYTGNVKEEGEHDYIHSGRGSNVVHMTTEDGMHFSEKMLVLTNADYPENCTAHVRDPKIYKEKDGSYRMVLGARLNEDKGALLIYRSEDLSKFAFEELKTTEDPFGYMWECPDIFLLEGKKIISLSPQGVESEEYRYQNIYQSGYFIGGLDGFEEWDMGFDFYAPQTFEDEKGRRILVGWAGVPDAQYKSRMATDEWQHMMTIPRELKLAGDKILQEPVKEVEALRKEPVPVEQGKAVVLKDFRMDLLLENQKKMTGEIWIGEEFVVQCKEDQISISFSGKSGAGRDTRKAKISNVYRLRILVDVSIVEIFVNDGEMVFTSRIFLEEKSRFVKIQMEAEMIRLYPMDLYPMDSGKVND